ncbi:Fructose-bisphosphate aldolase 6, cytosolic [Fulvia fulva]|uniref:fructose-bisphosphate aldolase n=1 Tax=Passalora fulva TaxID=5499 RepID=A0A9Q8PL32_PASFU|nr:Fructose-bisphosphate aldolase 6, cytosolic [Fulvia fulva]KAK4610099.1 Fructose-bisphosphate aldolase 6, cytosolic [Fulvia fulva]KAK4611344.1 Fructose-bisphosphate aldolase 6, cytosolic [Fulvia fulva]UJO24410.1 Fructose-bisphosphate aldolase 6, cytosolic [Fulvia fulva]WPV22313.1 Fructose-bisphosphate aldolase 6, cytosolic [Fulvia fulva]WPV37190.1 Fructose-bisphosphate aldolase 6, cytosolic [Fulvia fulva]
MASLTINDAPSPVPYTKELHATAKALGAAGKGLLAADESTSSIEKRLEGVGKETTEDNRREWRDMLFTAAGPIEDTISGVITFEETLMKHDAQLESKYQGKALVDVIKARGIIPGIKVDKGTVALPRTSPEETTTQGLDGLEARCREFYERGARFSKWRCTYTVSAATPSALAIMDNAEVLARYAAISQQAGLVPIVEPEVLMTHDQPIERALEAHVAAYSALFERLALHKVDLAGLVLKASFVTPGKEHSKAKPEEVAEATVACLSKTVPPQVPTIVFLSGGFSDADSIEYLNAINKRKQENAQAAPWALTFSFGRALQGVAMQAWADGKSEESQKAWVDRAKWSGEAAVGKYAGGCPS